MPRPSTNIPNINSQAGNWDQTVDQNFDQIEDFFKKPTPLGHVHRSTPDSGSTALSGYAAADYKWCQAICVDPATVATNGYAIVSNGTNWIYIKSGNIVS